MSLEALAAFSGGLNLRHDASIAYCETVLALEERVLQLILPCAREVSFEIIDSYLTLLEAHGYVSSLEIALLKGKFCGTEGLELVLDDVEPYHLHLDLGVVSRLPYHHLLPQMQTQEYSRCYLTDRVFSAKLF